MLSLNDAAVVSMLAAPKEWRSNPEQMRCLQVKCVSMPSPLYDRNSTTLDKISTVVKCVYGGDGIEVSDHAQQSLDLFERWGFTHLPVCIAKTQYSLSGDPKRMGAPTGWKLRVSGISLSAGAGFLVVTSDAVMLMPGLPITSRALNIDVDTAGEITGMS